VGPLPWRAAWHRALYAAELGFYVTRGGPAAHFTTAAHGVAGRVLAEGFLRLWQREQGPRAPAVVVDVGAGRGELLGHLVSLVESTVRLVGVDVVERPPGLDARIEWVRSPGGAGLPVALAGLDDALVVSNEWLDVVPCTIAQAAAGGLLREVLVDPETGEELLGEALGEAEREWVRRHWPDPSPGDRVEVGLARDEAWSDLVSRVASGLVVAVDYGHLRESRPSGGTLAGYRSGTLVPAVPDGSCDITAHVAVDSLDSDRISTQRELLRDLGLRGVAPAHELAKADPLGYLRALERAGAEAELIRRGGFGDFWWVVKRVSAHDVP